MLGITPPESDEISQSGRRGGSHDHRAIVAYAQYKDVGQLLPDLYDETITRRWGVDVELATPILSLQILVPSMERDPQETQRMEIPTRKISGYQGL